MAYQFILIPILHKMEFCEIHSMNPHLLFQQSDTELFFNILRIISLYNGKNNWCTYRPIQREAVENTDINIHIPKHPVAFLKVEISICTGHSEREKQLCTIKVPTAVKGQNRKRMELTVFSLNTPQIIYVFRGPIILFIVCSIIHYFIVW